MSLLGVRRLYSNASWALPRRVSKCNVALPKLLVAFDLWDLSKAKLSLAQLSSGAFVCVSSLTCDTLVMSQLDSSLSQLNWLINKSRREYDADEKPNLSYSQLIKMAIENSAEKRCTLSEIYSYITSNYPYYRTHANPNWKNSIRHNLSLNKQFVRESREIGDIGKGSYWRCVPAGENLKSRRYRLESEGEGPRLNPAIQKIFCPQNSQNAAVQPVTKPLMIQPESPSTSCNYEFVCESSQQENAPLAADDVSDINLFESMNLSASFRDLYEQLFPASKKSDREKKVAQIDWLKASLETIGMDYQNEDEVRNIDMDRFKKLVECGVAVDGETQQPPLVATDRSAGNHDNFINGLYLYDANCSLNELNKDFSVVDSVSLQTPSWAGEEEDSDDFDWETLIDR
ncbi:Forkhead box protein K2 [Toxocara canis]|uniref:Forkhead box protein fkh-2 n=1 Tax=Toxocara canis TaxID=6265 RepID=A0A0B2VU26_TOXCA|nr:Forkhead box protein K2 [Toxocara canis]